MKNVFKILMLILIMSSYSLSQEEKTAKKLEVNGIVLYSYINDGEYFCPVGSSIIIDSNEYDFIGSNDVNYSIIRENKGLIETLGKPDGYYTSDIFQTLCAYKKHDTIVQKFNCDSILNIFSKNNIYDTSIFKKDFSSHMVSKTISSNFFTKKYSDTIYLAFSLSGKVIKYENVTYGRQTDYRETVIGDSVYFDDSHGSCPFEKLNTTFIVLNKVKRLKEINREQSDSLGLKASERKEIKIFLHH